MHIPDGPLSPEVCVVTGAVSLGVVSYSLHKLKDSLADKTIPMTGMMAALIFAGQMVNFPLIGTSGHLMGGVLAAVVLGPWAGCVALTIVLVVQCLMFGDGGILSLGANVLHMAVVGSLGGYAIYASIRRLFGNKDRGTIVGAVVASWVSVMAAAALFCLEFRLSHPSDPFKFRNIFTLMVAVHSLIGICEALITGVIVNFVLRERPDLIYSPDSSTNLVGGFGRFVAAGVICSLAVAAFLAPFASEMPDGLDAVAQKFGISNLESNKRYSLLPDYEMPLPVEGWQSLSVSLAGVGGTVTVLVIALLLGRAVRIGSSLAEANRVE